MQVLLGVAHVHHQCVQIESVTRDGLHFQLMSKSSFVPDATGVAGKDSPLTQSDSSFLCMWLFKLFSFYTCRFGISPSDVLLCNNTIT